MAKFLLASSTARSTYAVSSRLTRRLKTVRMRVPESSLRASKSRRLRVRRGGGLSHFHQTTLYPRLDPCRAAGRRNKSNSGPIYANILWLPR